MAPPWRPAAECARALGSPLRIFDAGVPADGAVEAAPAAQRPLTAGSSL